MLKKQLVLLVLMFFSAISLQAADTRFTLVIDPGHGGNDAGAVGVISKEKDINLKVALAFGRYVERNCPDVKVIYTRKNDTFVTLQGRANIANKNKADLFISIHTNAVERGKSVKGFEVYTLGMHRAGDNLDVAKRENSVITLEADYKSRYQGFDPNSSESYIMFEYLQDKNMESSVKLARLIQNNVCRSASRINKGVHQAGFLVLRESSMPSCLIELGFISNPEEERQLNDPIIQEQMAIGIYKAFQSYRGKTANVDIPVSTPALTQEPLVSRTEAAPVETSVPVVETITEVTTHDVKKEQTVAPVVETDNSMPVFCVQILVASKELKPSDYRLKGLTDTKYYCDGGLYKYTYGASNNYNDIYKLRKQIIDKFPEAFIVALKDGVRVDVNEAIKEWKSKR